MKIIKLCFVLAVFVLAACQNQANTQDDAHGHSHDDVSIQITEYNTEFEVFAEAEPMVAGKPGGILAHFTHLSDFSPLTEGSVSASLIIGTKGIRQKLDEPTRPGIYLFQLQPEVAGKGKLVFDIETPNGKSSITVNGIEVFADEHDAIHEAEQRATENPNAISFTKEQSWKIDFETGLPSLGAFGEVIKTTARVQSSQTDEIILTAKTNGIVQFKSDNISEGTEVLKGNALFYVTGEAFADNNPQVRLNEAKNNFEKAEADYNRKAELVKDKLVSEQDFLDSKAAYENSKIVYNNLKKNFSNGGQNVASPKAGFVKHIYVSSGQYVEAGPALVSISENKNLFLKAEVQQKYAAALPFIKTANVRSLNSEKVFSLEELQGKVVSYGKNVSEESYLIPVTLQVQNRAEIVPGSFMELFLKTESKINALTVPNSALIEEQGNFAVFVQLNPESFLKREVKVGKTDGKETEILSGLNASERIVTRGGILVKLAAVSNSLDPHAGHVH
jgi:RND family efflux transporter MFP subunit